MKQLIKILILFVVISCSSIQQENNREEFNNLYYICKIWGYLKYHHPNISNNNIDWDASLLKILDDDKIRTSVKERDNFFMNILDSLGTVENTIDYGEEQYSEYLIYPNYEWLSVRYINKLLCDRLLALSKIKMQENKYYSFSNDIPTFNESGYWEANNNSYYILGLFRYWNAIEYFFPYKSLITKDWDSILQEEIAIFSKITNDSDYLENLLRLSKRIEDGHSSIYNVRDDGISVNNFYKEKNLLGFNGIPVEIGLIKDTAIVTNFCNKKGFNQLELGDQIISFDGRTIAEIIEYRKRVYPSRYMPEYEILGGILVSSKDSVEVKYRRNNIQYNELMKTEKFLWDSPTHHSEIYERVDTTHYIKSIKDDIYYIDFSNITNNSDTYKDFIRIQNSKGLIIDLRRYPKNIGYFLYGLFKDNPYNNMQFYAASKSIPGAYSYINDNQMINMSFFNPSFYKGYIVLLVGAQTQSYGETLAMMLQGMNNTITIGTKTSGTNGNISSITLPGYLNARFTCIGVQYKDKTAIYKQGIKLDYTIAPTVSNIKKSKDNQLLFALELLENKIKQMDSMQNETLSFECAKDKLISNWFYPSKFNKRFTHDSLKKYHGRYSLLISNSNINDTTFLVMPFKMKNINSTYEVSLKTNKHSKDNFGLCINENPYEIHINNTDCQITKVNDDWFLYEYKNLKSNAQENYLTIYLTGRSSINIDDVRIKENE